MSEIYDIAPSIEDILKENQWLKIEIKELKVLNEHLNKYIDNFRQNSDIQYLHDNQQIYKLKQAIKILKEFVTITKGKNEETKKWDIPIIYSLGLNKKISQEQYELLEEVFESVGDSDE